MFKKIIMNVAVSTTAVLAGLGLNLAAAEDALPAQSVAFFNLSACPEGWTPFSRADGRLVASLMPGGGNGALVGDTPLSDLENRTHQHKLTASFTTTKKSYVLIGGCCNESLGNAGTYSFTGTTEPASSNLPYTQLLMCQKLELPPEGSESPPSGMLIYSGGFDCPPGYTNNQVLQGRFMIGLPKSGSPGVSFGGPPLKTGQQNTHKHTIDGTVSMPSHDIAGAGGCCADGYAGSDNVTASGATDDFIPGAELSEAVDLPYIELLQCEAN